MTDDDREDGGDAPFFSVTLPTFSHTPATWWHGPEADDAEVVSLADLLRGIAEHLGTPALARWWLGMSFAAGHFGTVFFKRGVIHDAAVDGEPCVHEDPASPGRWKRESRMERLLREAPEAVTFDPDGDAVEYVVEPDDDGTRWRCFLEGLGFPKAVLAYYGDKSGTVPAPEKPKKARAGRKSVPWLDLALAEAARRAVSAEWTKDNTTKAEATRQIGEYLQNQDYDFADGTLRDKVSFLLTHLGWDR
jgi:hypothetical protein